MVPGFVKRIWHIEGSLALAPGQSTDEAFGRLDPLFRAKGTSHDRVEDTLTFRKKDPAAQDKMSIFDGGVLQIRKGMSGSVLHYQLTSPALLFCFLAPLLFLAFAQLTVAVGKLEGPTGAAEKKADEEKTVLTQHPIDKALGAPAPEDPKKKGKDKSEDDDKPSPTAAYAFAGIFAILYAVGRILEQRLVKRLFERRLSGQ